MSVAPDPTDLAAIRARLGDGRGGRNGPRLASIGLRRIVLDEDALDVLVELVADVRRPGPIAVLADATPMRRGPDDLKRLVVDRLGTRFEVRPVVLESDGTDLHADRPTIARARALLRGVGCVVAVGSGTICDIGKAATDRHAAPPYVVVQTACSVNAFSDNLAVLLVDGVKRTFRSRWPDALLVDLGVIADAPPEMNRAGVGELLSMFTAPADWYIAAALGLDPGFDDRVVGLFRDGGEALLAAAPGVARGDREALRDLCSLMTLSGIALGVAGRSAPISGLEHAVSHLLDMAATVGGRPVGRHGAQVGVAAAVAAAWWARTLGSFDPERIVERGATLDHDRVRRSIEAAFGALDPSGAMAAECWREVARKLARWREAEARRRDVAVAWEAHRTRLAQLVCAPDRIVAALRAAGAPARFSELDPPVPPETVRWAFRSACLLRERFGVADLDWLAGGGSERDGALDAAVEAALDAAGSAGGGL